MKWLVCVLGLLLLTQRAVATDIINEASSPELLLDPRDENGQVVSVDSLHCWLTDAATMQQLAEIAPTPPTPAPTPTRKWGVGPTPTPAPIAIWFDSAANPIVNATQTNLAPKGYELHHATCDYCYATCSRHGTAEADFLVRNLSGYPQPTP